MLTQAAPASAATAGTGSGLPHQAPDPALRAMLHQVDPARIEATILRLTQFGTRHTGSSQTDPVRGIGAATAWVFDQMQAIAATSGGRMTVQKQTFTQPVSSRIPVPTSITNVIATLQGTASPQRFYVVTGHLDSRVTDVLDFTSDAPGADDDGSGVAVVLESARLFAAHQFPGTLVFATVAGEEQGLYGSTFMAKQMAAAGNDVQGMFSNDIVGASQGWDGTRPDPFTVRMFVEGVPTAATASDIAIMQAVGGEKDGLSRQLGRFVQEVAPFDLTGMNIRLIWRRDRYLRGSDHLSFQGQGYPAARFTEPRENFAHEHRNGEVVNALNRRARFTPWRRTRGSRTHNGAFPSLPQRCLFSLLRGEREFCERGNKRIDNEAGLARILDGGSSRPGMCCRMRRLPRSIGAVRDGKADHQGRGDQRGHPAAGAAACRPALAPAHPRQGPRLAGHRHRRFGHAGQRRGTGFGAPGHLHQR